MVPSAARPARSTRCSRAWTVERNDSRRSSTQRTGRPVARHDRDGGLLRIKVELPPEAAADPRHETRTLCSGIRSTAEAGRGRCGGPAWRSSRSAHRPSSHSATTPVPRAGTRTDAGCGSARVDDVGLRERPIDVAHLRREGAADIVRPVQIRPDPRDAVGQRELCVADRGLGIPVDVDLVSCVLGEILPSATTTATGSPA